MTTKTMKALVKAKEQPGLWMEEQPIPECGVNDVKIKISKTAICGTDLHIYNWDEWSQKTVPVPMITGHEFVGNIVEIGSHVTGYSIGDRVSGEGHITCGHCRNCRAGKRHLCNNTLGVGVNRQGCFAEYLVIPSSNAFKVSEEISDNIASIFDPYGNAAHTALSFDLVGEDVLITGAGPIGIMAAAICKHAGARNIVVTDINDYRLELAKELGATYVSNPKNESLEEVMRKTGMSEGFDVGLEMSGNASAFRSMLESMNNGGKIGLLGIFSSSVDIDWSLVTFKGLFIKGIYGREMYETWYKMSSMLQSGLDISKIVTHEFPIDDFEKGFKIMQEGQSGKVVLDWN